MLYLILVFWEKDTLFNKKLSDVYQLVKLLAKSNYLIINILNSNNCNIPSNYTHLIIMGSRHNALTRNTSIVGYIKSTIFYIMKYSIQQSIPILGICYGCQLINLYFGGSLIYCDPINHMAYKGYYLNYLSNLPKRLIKHINNPFYAKFSNKYCIDSTTFPKSLEIIAKTPDIISMIRHTKYAMYGCQVQP